MTFIDSPSCLFGVPVSRTPSTRQQPCAVRYWTAMQPILHHQSQAAQISQQLTLIKNRWGVNLRVLVRVPPFHTYLHGYLGPMPDETRRGERSAAWGVAAVVFGGVAVTLWAATAAAHGAAALSAGSAVL